MTVRIHLLDCPINFHFNGLSIQTSSKIDIVFCFVLEFSCLIKTGPFLTTEMFSQRRHTQQRLLTRPNKVAWFFPSRNSVCDSFPYLEFCGQWVTWSPKPPHGLRDPRFRALSLIPTRLPQKRDTFYSSVSTSPRNMDLPFLPLLRIVTYNSRSSGFWSRRSS